MIAVSGNWKSLHASGDGPIQGVPSVSADATHPPVTPPFRLTEMFVTWYHQYPLPKTGPFHCLLKGHEFVATGGYRFACMKVK